MDPEVVSALVRVVQGKDQATAAHTWRVALYTLALAEAAGAPQSMHRRLMRAAVLHDIGKLDLPENILGKRGKLTDEEYEIVKLHPRLGHERLVRMGETDEIVLAVVRSHHERLDGTGYPDGLRGEAIPVPARRFAVIDSFDAMTSLRPYRDDVGHDAAGRALDELARHAGTWYCPEAVSLLTSVYESGALDWILHHLNDDQSLLELPATPDAETLAEARSRIARVDPPVVETKRRNEEAVREG